MEQPRPVFVAHYAAGVMWRWNPEKQQPEFLVIQSSREGRVETKFPGGTNREFEYHEETVVETLRREWLQEVGARIVSLRPEPMFVSVPDERGHAKHFYFMDESDHEGTLRSQEIVEEVPGRSREVVTAPFWMVEEDLDLVIMRTHRSPFEKGCEWAYIAHERTNQKLSA